MKIIIPARLGSKSLPFNNRELFKYTAGSIPEERRDSVIVTSDDPEILKSASNYSFDTIRRPVNLGADDTSIRDVIFHTIQEAKIPDSEFIVMLYLTYPERTWDEVIDAFHYFLDYNYRGITNSMLCRKEISVSPYLFLEERGVNGLFGKPLVSHDLYRRQDYPKCFEISHYISIFKAGEIFKLNKNLYCDTTIFYPIGQVIDVDYKKDLEKFNGK
jgi:CMP-N-acetylneuraminic acid synthetase